MKLSVLSYNIRHGGVGRIEQIANVINAQSPDVVIFQEATLMFEAWPFIALELVKHLGGRTISRVSRSSAASTATGSPKVHAAEQAKIMQKALTL